MKRKVFPLQELQSVFYCIFLQDYFSYRCLQSSSVLIRAHLLWILCQCSSGLCVVVFRKLLWYLIISRFYCIPGNGNTTASSYKCDKPVRVSKKKKDLLIFSFIVIRWEAYLCACMYSITHPSSWKAVQEEFAIEPTGLGYLALSLSQHKASSPLWKGTIETDCDMHWLHVCLSRAHVKQCTEYVEDLLSLWKYNCSLTVHEF